MPTPKDQRGLLGTIIPSVLVDVITLEAGGKPPELSDPHVEHEWESGERNRVIDPGTLKLTVDTSIKELISDSPISKWFGSKFARYVKLTILATTHKEITAALSSSNDGISILNRAYNHGQESAAAKVLKATYPGENITEALQKRASVKTFNIYSDAISDQLESTQHTSFVDDDGNVVHDINFRAVFDVRGSEPNHLSVFAMTHLDMDLLIEDYGLTVDETTLKAQNGKIVSEVIIDRGRVVNEAFLFTKSDGVVWTGPVHDTGNGTWATGEYSDQYSLPLSLNKVVNNKVQDFRNVDKLERLSVDLSTMQNRIFSGTANELSMLRRKKNTTPPRNVYFSDMYLAKDRKGNARMSFAVDYLKMLRENSVFESLFQTANKQQQAELSASCKIRSLRVMRRRIKNVRTMNSLGNMQQGEVLFDKKAAPHTVASSGEVSFGVFKEKKNETGELREAFYSVDMSDVPVRFFAAVDKDISRVTDGIYQYGVEMVVEDASQKYLFSLIRMLRHHRKKLHDYYLDAQKIGMSKYIVELQDPHIDDSKWERAALNKNTPANFSPTTGRFTNKFITEQYEKYENNLGSAPWVAPVIGYFTILNLFTGFAKDNQEKALEVLMSVIKYADPFSGSPKGVMAIIKMMDKLISRTSLIAGSDVPLGEGESRLQKLPDGGSSSTSKFPTRTTKIQHWFTDNNFDSNFFRNYGFDYLSNHNYNNQHFNTLRVVSGNEYSQRTIDEFLKYFTSEDVSVDISGITSDDSMMKTGYGYLSPGLAYLGSSKVYMGTGGKKEMVTADQYTAIEASIATSKNFGAPTTTPQVHKKSSLPPEAQLYQANMMMQASKLNMTILPSLTEIAKPLTEGVASIRRITIDTDFCTVRVPSDNRIDPIVSDANEGFYKKVHENINANSFFATLQSDLRKANRWYDGSTNHPFGSTTTSTVSTGAKNSATTSTMEVGTIKQFNLMQKENVINHLQKDESYLGEVAKVHGTVPTSVSDVVKKCPNQVKSLLVASQNPSVVQENWHQYDYDVVKDPRTSSQYNFMYNMINKVEVLVKYDGTIKRGEWQVLTKDYWDSTQGQELLCRMIPYECKLFGIFRPKSLNISIYDEHFILKPSTITARGQSQQSSQIDIIDIFDSDNIVSELVVSKITSSVDVGAYPGATTTNVVGTDAPTSASHPCGEEVAIEAGI